MRTIEMLNYLIQSAAWFVAGIYGRQLWDRQAVSDARRG